MGGFGQQLKVLKAIIVFLAIEMVDNLSREERATKVLAHHETMFENSSLLRCIGMVGDGEQDIAMAHGTSFPMIVPWATSLVPKHIANRETAFESEGHRPTERRECCAATTATIHILSP